MNVQNRVSDLNIQVISTTILLVPLDNEQPASVRCQNERNKVTQDTDSKALHKQQSLRHQVLTTSLLHCPSVGSLVVKEGSDSSRTKTRTRTQIHRLLSTWNV